MRSWMQRHWQFLILLLIATLPIYLDLLQWKKHGDDFVVAAISLVVSILFWVFALLVGVRYWKDAVQAKRCQKKLVALTAGNNQLVGQLQSKQDEIKEMENRYLENLDKTKSLVACQMLAEEAEQLWNKLRGIKREATAPGMVDADALKALEKPLEDPPWPWHSRALLEFRYMYGQHQTRIGKFAPSDLNLDLKSFPIPTTSKDCEEAITLLLQHQKRLTERANECLARLNFRRVSASAAL